MDEFGAIEFQDLDLGEMVKLRVSLKSIDGKLFVDVRKWVKWPNIDHFIATKKGIMLSCGDWKKAITMIESMIVKDEALAA